jgi:hypothetical protein
MAAVKDFGAQDAMAGLALKRKRDASLDEELERQGKKLRQLTLSDDEGADGTRVWNDTDEDDKDEDYNDTEQGDDRLLTIYVSQKYYDPIKWARHIKITQP